MTRQYSIRRRIYKTAAEIIVGGVLLLAALLAISAFLTLSGQLTQPKSIHFSLGASTGKSTIVKALDASPYDYAVFERSSGKRVAGRAAAADFPRFEATFLASKDKEAGTVHYKFLGNHQLAVVLRYNDIPEFTSHALRQIPYNNFSFVFLILGLLLIIVYAVAKLGHELSQNFRAVQEISQQMGERTENEARRSSKITEFEDILSHLYQKSEELAALIEAEQKEKQDLSFQVAALSHDVKTPLTVLKGNIELLEMTELSSQQLSFLQSMNNSLAVFEQYFAEMINYTRLLSADDKSQEEFKLTEFLDRLSNKAEALAEAKQTQFQFHWQISCRQKEIQGNALDLERALMNLLENACNYAEFVLLTVKEDKSQLHFEVWNNGPVYSDSALENAHKLFYSEGFGRGNQHHGIGLAFAHAVASKMGGQLLLENPTAGGALAVLTIRK
ncbi:MAG: HAMP domain-containing histidine kinase [Streptococcaceae bacterium]|jgi:signal transduction histidine kinase|nr:HAMP domain-containing histidine kinase [Streptococcaceae bacterium]